jgi:hypothetical protein
MKKALLLLSALAVFLLFSCDRDQYRIHGRVTSNELEDIQVFLVPLGQEDAEHVDSVHIHDHTFSFKGKEHRMCEIRLSKYHRDQGQNLLVVTEPGDIYVTIGPDSRGGGTPQNDSLQVWKDLTINRNRLFGRLYDAGLKTEADSVHSQYKERTWAMARSVGEESILGAFLLNLYPQPQE